MKPKKLGTEMAVNLVLIISVSFALYFFYGLLQLLQNVRLNDILGAPSSYAAWPSGLLAIYAFARTANTNKRYVAVSVVTVLVAGFLVWLFGITAAGSGLVPDISP